MTRTTMIDRHRTRGAATPHLRDLEGREVSLALADGSRLDGVTLVSAGRGRTPTVWVYAGGMDLFVPRTSVVDAWEARPPRAA
ncbi:MAG TPA: hypothetical protein VFZ77_03195 [Acidimicrobiales bacterium]